MPRGKYTPEYDERAMPTRTQIDVAIAALNWYMNHESDLAVGVAIQDFAHRALIGKSTSLTSPSFRDLRDQLLIKKIEMEKP